MFRQPSSSYRPVFGTVGQIPVPYDVPAACYAQPTDDYPYEGGFANELQDDMESCEGCRDSLGSASPGAWCGNVKTACEGWGIIPEGMEPGSISADMISACISQCQHDQAAALVQRYCKTAPATPPKTTPPKTTPPSGKTPTTPVTDTDTGSKSSIWPWIVGGAVVAAVGLLAVNAAWPNPTPGKRMPLGGWDRDFEVGDEVVVRGRWDGRTSTGGKLLGKTLRIVRLGPGTVETDDGSVWGALVHGGWNQRSGHHKHYEPGLFITWEYNVPVNDGWVEVKGHPGIHVLFEQGRAKRLTDTTDTPRDSSQWRRLQDDVYRLYGHTFEQRWYVDDQGNAWTPLS